MKTMIRNRIWAVMKSRLPDGQHRIAGRTYLFSRNASAYGDPAGTQAKTVNPQTYDGIAAALYNELGLSSFRGIHPKLSGLAPSASSWIPFIPSQTVAQVFNFLSVHYGLNSPFVIVYRYVLFNDRQEKIFDQSYTKVIRVNSGCHLADPEDIPFTLEQRASAGRLVIYAYDPRFRPAGKQLRFVGMYKSNDTYKAACHSWGSAQDFLFGARTNSGYLFGHRRYVPEPSENNAHYEYFQEIGAPVDCDVKPSRGANELSVKDGAPLFSDGYFLALDADKNVRRIWHDNGPYGREYSSPNIENVGQFRIDTDFYVPAQGYYAALIIPNPILDFIAVNEVEISAYGDDSDRCLHSAKYRLDEGAKATSLHQFSLDLKGFFDDLHDLGIAGDRILQLTASFQPIASDLKKEYAALAQIHVFVYAMNGEVCDQFHTQISHQSLRSDVTGSGSYGYRTNKFGPYVCSQFNQSYILINNRFPYDRPLSRNERVPEHKLRLTLYPDDSDEYVVKFLAIKPGRKFYAVSIAEMFDLKIDEGASQGTVHLFCGTANFWCYYMITGKDAHGQLSLLCDHTTGG